MITKNQPIQDKPLQPEEETAISLNYDALKIEFMEGPWETVEDFKKDKNIIIDDFDINSGMEEWEEEKQQLVGDKTKELTGEVVPISPVEIELSRRRQAEVGRKLQRKGLLALKLLDPKSAEQARRMIVSGLQEERAAMGFAEKGGQPSSLTQVNFNLPKTKFDKIINEEDFAGILKLIAEIKRERARRVGGIATGQSKATVK